MFILFSVKFEGKKQKWKKQICGCGLIVVGIPPLLALINRLALFFEGLQSWQVESGAL